MATPLFCCGAECGIDTLISAHWGLTGATFATNIVRTGSRSIRSNPTAGLAYGRHTIVGAQRNVVRVYIYLVAHPTAIASIVSFGDATNTLGMIYDTVTSKYYAYTKASLSLTGITLSLNQWYRIDIDANTSGTTWTCDLSVDGVAQAQASIALSVATNMTELNVGNRTVNSTHDVYYDDVWYSATGADYPYGAGKVLSFLPARDGTHTGTAGMFDQGNSGGPDILSTTTDAYRLVSKRPLQTAHDTTFSISALILCATQYCECLFENTLEPNAPRAVEVLYAYSAAGTLVGDHMLKISDNGTEGTVQAFSAAGTLACSFFTKQFATPPTGGAWNVATSGNGAFNNLRLRFGYGTDLNPDQFLDGVMIEAEFPDSEVKYLNTVFCCGFECGVFGSHWTLNVAGAEFNTSTFRSGLRSLRLNPSAASSLVYKQVEAGVRIRTMRFYLRVTTAPNVDYQVVGMSPALGDFWGLGYKASDGKFYALGATTYGATGVTLTTGVQHQVDIKINKSANPALVDVMIDGLPLGQSSHAIAAADVNYINIGLNGNATCDMYIDDLIVTNGLNDYPIGPGHIISLVPGSDGTHTATGTNVVKGTVAAPTGGGAITSATTDAFNRVNARPIGGGVADSTFLINQQTIAALEYAEVITEPSTEPNIPRAVEILVADRQASTAVGSMEIRTVQKITTPNGEVTVVNLIAVAGQVTDKYTTKQLGYLAPGGVPWTVAIVKDLRHRFGYSIDATPDQYWRGVIVEAEYADLPPYGGRPFGLVGQNQMNQLLAT